MKKYGLMHEDGSLMGFSTSSNAGVFAVDVGYSLEKLSENIWLVDSKTQAEIVSNTNTPWYNAGYNSPENSYVAELKVVEIEMIIKEV